MAKIAFILLCHKDPAGIIAQARRLTASGDFIAIHFDRNANSADFDRIRTELASNPNVAFTKRRVKCGWGEYSLVDATLLTTRTAFHAFPEATHFYMLSGDCMPVKSAEYAKDFLDRDDVDYIESFDFFKSDWIKTGIKEERLIYRHYFNERRHKPFFYASLALQQKLGLSRSIPGGLEIQIGSQWWCLRRSTVESVLNYCNSHPEVLKFFATTWIPDETMFQTLVRHLVPDKEIKTRTLTFLMFSDYGLPLTFYNDHFELLASQDYLFARKISPQALELKKRLGDLWAEEGRQFPISNEGRTLLTFMRQRGRIGRRFAPRFWETESSIGRERQLTIIICKKWHVAKRLVDRMADVLDIRGVHYLFNEASTPLPALGGIETTLAKRTRHRRALMRMLFDYWGTDRMVVCMDPSNLELMEDFVTDKALVRLVEIDCEYDDDYLIGHALRVGLAGEETPPETMQRILPTIRYDIRFESDRIRDAGFARYRRIRQKHSPEQNARVLSEFLGIPEGKAHEITSTHYLFMD
ncbi:DUF5928 domain-containing protein [Falsirhodobacter sp. alg1]|uniref:DUF5928 domain-containing protein n=1 Tax=Falsirhodobacter sp. alg1 TaxID=1472418 RepID=UPI0005F088B5|nr:DUF5928 domain-containing protein [Falsirhodobacter sp. alg1]